MVQLVRLFLAKVVRSSWYGIQSTVSWKPNKVLPRKFKFIRDCQERAKTLQSAFMPSNQCTEIILDSDAPLKSAKDIVSTKPNFVSNEITGAFCPACTHEEALQDSHLSLTESSFHYFIG